MEVKAIKMDKALEKNNDIYSNVVIAAKRSRQIIDSRVLDFESIEDVEDSYELEELEEKIRESKMPKSVEKIARKELNRMQKIPQQSPCL